MREKSDETDQDAPIIPPEDEAGLPRNEGASVRQVVAEGKSIRGKSTRRNSADRISNARSSYAQSGARTKLVFLVLVFFMVLWAMNVAGRPQTWQWMFREPVKVEADSGVGDEATVQLSDGEAILRDSEPDSLATRPDARQESAMSAAREPAPGAGSAGGIVFAGKIDTFLTSFLGTLSAKEQKVFWQTAHSLVDDNLLRQGDTMVADRVVKSFADKWEAARRQNRLPDSPIPSGADDDAKAAADPVDWGDVVIPALGRALLLESPMELTPQHQEILAAFVSAFDRAAASLVEDFTAIGRDVEVAAWLSAWSAVFDAPAFPDEVVSRVGTTELLGQPEQWRGATVEVSGTALRVERVRAGNLPLPIDEYFVVWIKPDTVAAWPFCLYLLMPPEALRLNDEESVREVRLPITARARFYKVRLFNAENRAGQAPVLLAATATVTATSESPSTASSPSLLFRDPRWLIPVLLLIALAAVTTARLAWTTTRSRSVRGQPPSRRVGKSLQQIDDAGSIETLRDRLQRLEDGDGT